MKSVFVTRKIPEVGLAILRSGGCVVDINPHDRPLSKEELVTALRAKPYDAVLTLLNDRVDGEIFDAAPSAKIFANYAIGFDNFDVEEGKRRGVFLTNVPGGGADRVAEHVWGLILALTCRIVEGDAYVRQGKYLGWDPLLLHGGKIAGKTLGLIGAGRIGAQVATIGANGFGMRVVYYDIARNESLESLRTASYYHSAEEVLRQADIVSTHVPLTDATKHLFDATRLAMMKPTAYLINTSRGPVIDEEALVFALKAGTIRGAGLDVFEDEPRLASGLAELPNVVLTPHIASASQDSRDDMSRVAAENIIQALGGSKPANLVYN